MIVITVATVPFYLVLVVRSIELSYDTTGTIGISASHATSRLGWRAHTATRAFASRASDRAAPPASITVDLDF